MTEKHNAIKMARAHEAEAVRTTIVGGRPPGSGQDLGAVPRGVEVLVKKAAVDAAFRAKLLEERAAAAAAIGLSLAPAEEALLTSIPAAQLEAIVGATRVPTRLHAVFMGTAAAAMLAALGVADAWATTDGDYVTRGVRTDDPAYNYPMAGVDAMTDDDVWLAALEAPADAGTIAGVVADANGDPLVGAEVTIEGTKVGATTDEYGRYVIASAAAGTVTLACECAGFASDVRENVKVVKGVVTAVNFSLFFREEPCGGARPDEPGEDY